jgi:thioredoxin 1
MASSLKLANSTRSIHDIHHIQSGFVQRTFVSVISVIMKGSFNKIIQSEIPVLIDFYADWCAPCKVLTPILKEVKEELGDAVKIVKIDVDKNNSIAGRFQVRGVPTMILFKEGTALWRQAGVLPKDQLLTTLRQYI